MSVINLSQFLEARGYVFYLVSMYTMTVGLALAILLCVWVSSSFRNSECRSCSVYGIMGTQLFLMR